MTEAVPETVNHSRAIALLKRHWALRLVSGLLLALGPALAAYTGASSDAKVEASVAKDKAEAGYQLSKHALEELRDSNRALQSRLAELEVEMAAIRRTVRVRRPEMTIVKVPPPQAPLPPTLDKALEHVQPAAPQELTK